MAHVTPYTAWRSVDPETATASASASAAAARGDGEAWPSLLRRWIDLGAVRRDASAAYHALELSAPGAPPARWVTGVLRAFNGAERPLETPSGEGGQPSLSLVPCLAADDRGVLDGLLAEVAGGLPDETYRLPDGAVARTFAVRGGGLSARFARALDDVLLRPLAPLDRPPALVAVAPLSEDTLQLRPWHRGLRGLEVFQEDRFLSVVSGYARIYELQGSLHTDDGRAEAAERMATLARASHAVLLVLPGGRGKILRVRQGLELEHYPAMPRNPTLRSLDLALLNALVLRTVLGIKDPERSPHAPPVASLSELVARTDAGDLQAGFALHAPPAWEIRAVMEAAQSLPPRCVQVEPLPPQGLLFLDPASPV